MKSKKIIGFSCLALILIAICSYYGLYMLTHKTTIVLNVDQLSKGKNIIPVLVIGSGPAGLSAALYTARAHCTTVVFAGNEPGGQLIHASYVENWPGKKKETGQEMMTDLKEQVVSFGVEIVNETIDALDCSHWPFKAIAHDGTIITALAVIMATGGSQKTLAIPGVKEYWGKGIGICTICDAPFDKGKEVAVIGGGDAAVDKALQLADFAHNVTILVPENRMSAARIAQGYAQARKNIALKYNIEVTKILGDETAVTGLEIINKQEKKSSVFSVQSVYFALGFEPNSTLVHSCNVACTKTGYIKVYDDTQKTTLAGLFAAGNVQDATYQKAGVAAGSGIKAGIDAIEFLENAGFNDEVSKKLEPLYYVGHTAIKGEVLPIATQQELEKLIASSENLIVVDFYAQGCPVCKHMHEVLENVAGALKEIKIVQVDSNALADVAAQYKINKVPVLVLIKGGKEVARMGAGVSYRDLIDDIKKYV